ncbi:hypothetical protein LXH09_33030 [Streptomyces sp. CS7]|uniref:hypothetical protein n=1 Tax=Streptomyces sp. CS-7 TaxID=2906769 RepID=UPI0021B15E9F|nr:hypothetical protein [Streptomyces sp. CS-7]MCT6781468.1 hypothetical protein [Streptomyces sp. CS-7]
MGGRRGDGLGSFRRHHPHLCDACKTVAVASATPTPGRQEQHQEPLPEWARQEFMRFPHRPRCTECKAAFTDERWKAVERTGWGGPFRMEARSTLCGDCDLQFESDLDQAWGVSRRQEQHDQEQDQADVLRPKSGGWFSCLRS